MKTMIWMLKFCTAIRFQQLIGKRTYVLLGAIGITSACCFGFSHRSIHQQMAKRPYIAEKPMFIVKCDMLSEIGHVKEPMLLCMDNGGGLRDISAHEIEEDDLQSILRPGREKTKCVIILQVEDKAGTSVRILEKILAKLRATSDPQRETVIVVNIDTASLSGKGGE